MATKTTDANLSIITIFSILVIVGVESTVTKVQSEPILLLLQNRANNEKLLIEAERLNQQVIQLYDQGRYVEAIPIAQQLVRIIQRLYQGDHPDVADSLNNLAILFDLQGRYSESEALHQQALVMRQRLYGGNHPDVAASLNNLGIVYRSQGKYNEAEALHQQALAMRQRLYGGNHLDVADSLNNLANVYESQGKYSEAESLYQQALAMGKKLYQVDHPLVADSLNNLALLYQSQGRYSESEDLYQQALAMRQRLYREDHPHIADSLNNLASIYQSQGKYSEAEPLCQQALAMTQRLYEGDHPDIAASFTNLGNVYLFQGRYSKAEPLYQQALVMQQRLYEGDHPDIATSLFNLALVYQLLGRYSESEALYQQALAMSQGLYQEDHPHIADSLNSIANVYQSQEIYSEAETLYQQALAMRQRLYQEDHPHIADSLNSIALLYRLQKRYNEALPLLQQVLAMRQRLYQEDHPDIADSLNSLSAVFFSQKRYNEALPLLQQVLVMRQKLYQENHPDIADSLTNLALLYWSQENYFQALEFLTQATEIEEAILTQNLSGSQANKTAYLATFRSTTDATISLHLQYQPNNQQAARLALNTILRRKGRILDSVANILPSLCQRLNPQDQQLLDQLADTQSQLSTLVLKGVGNTPPQQYQQQVKILSNQAEQIEAQLAGRSNEFATHNMNVTISAVQQQIPDDATLLEFVRYQPVATKIGEYELPRYAVYVLSSQGEPQWLDLGEAETIDSMVDEFRRQLTILPPQDSPGLQKRANRQIRQTARNLDQLIMQPVRQLIGDQTHLLLSPDSQLNLIPFGALVDENDNYLVENYAITYLTSGRDLLRLQSTSSPKQAPVVVANPDYQTDVQIIVNQEQTQSNNTGDNRSYNLRNLQNCCSPLEGTKLEAEAIATLLPNIELFTETAATETAVKGVNAPSILHIASHGFFLPALEIEPPPNRGLSTDSLLEQPIAIGENPLLRSGLALAGFNPSQGNFDGALTALEVTGLNLWGTELVVLSACSTGVGEVVDGEGIYGLRRALVIAGSQSQLISLWNISDLGTKDLMQNYYQKLLDGYGRTEALRQTQLELLQSEQYNHPFYWAAFIPSGNWTAIDINALKAQK